MKTSMIILKMRTKKRINNRKVAFCDQEEKSNKELRETGASFSVRVPEDTKNRRENREYQKNDFRRCADSYREK